MSAGTFYGNSSHRQLMSAEPVLRIWATRVLAQPDLEHDLAVHEGHRSKQRQNRLHAKGLSKLRWPHGRHNARPSRAVDIVPIVDGKKTWDRAAMEKVAAIGLRVWGEMVEQGVAHGPMTWGGDWDRDGDSADERFFDGAHFEIGPQP